MTQSARSFPSGTSAASSTRSFQTASHAGRAGASRSRQTWPGPTLAPRVAWSRTGTPIPDTRRTRAAGSPLGTSMAARLRASARSFPTSRGSASRSSTLIPSSRRRPTTAMTLPTICTSTQHSVQRRTSRASARMRRHTASRLSSMACSTTWVRTPSTSTVRASIPTSAPIRARTRSTAAGSPLTRMEATRVGGVLMTCRPCARTVRSFASSSVGMMAWCASGCAWVPVAGGSMWPMSSLTSF